uniref:DUF3444 domain-containing protein n=1 Tax=Brassica campestris TaxID=3711 RepID=A0A3P5ZW39_BRACM|nr:unnamed protein product [Brassica rapa]
MDLTINGVTETWINKESPSTAIQKFWTWCTECMAWYRLHRSFLHISNTCRSCNKEFYAREIPRHGLLPGKDSSKDVMHKRVLIKRLRAIQQSHPVASNTRPSFWTTCRNCGHRERFLKLYVDKWFVCEKCHGETIAMEVLARSGEVLFNKLFLELKPESKKNYSSALSCGVKVGEKRKREEEVAALSQNHSKPEGAVDKNIRGFNGNGDEASSSGDNKVDDNFGLCDSSSGRDVQVQPKIAECGNLKFNDFDKLREEVNFAVGQVWALYDTIDGVARQYALIRKVSVPSFGLRITYLEPDPDDEEEIQWFEEDLPVSAGKFRLGKNQNTKDRSLFSHVTHCNEGGSNSCHFTVSPRKGETWALFKNWDMNWSSEPDSHRNYEYEFVEILSDYYTDGAACVSVALLHKAKGFASVFFRMGTGEADTSQILPQNMYQFSHMIPSFKLTGTEAKGLPKDAYELDQAALPEKIAEVTIPSHLLAAPKPKQEELSFTINGKVFQAGQIWSYIGCFDNMPRDYCRLYKISATQAFEQAPVYKMHAFRFKATPLPKDIIPWEERRYADKKMPVGWGTYLLTQGSLALTLDRFSHLIVPVKERNEYTILPKIGEVWAIYRFWTPYLSVYEMEKNYVDYGIVEVLDDALDYKVMALEPALQFEEDERKKRVFRAAESKPLDFDDDDGSGVIFTIPRSKMLRFSHQIAASRVVKEIDGELKELFELDSTAVPDPKRSKLLDSLMDITIMNEASETSTTAQSSDRSMVWTICPFCSVRYKSYISLLNKPTRCHSCYLKFFASESVVKGTPAKDRATQTSFSTTEKSVSSQKHITRSSLVAPTPKSHAPTPKSQVQPQTAPSSLSPRFCAMCPSCKLKYRFPIKWTNKWFVCKCKKKFKTVEVCSSSLQQKTATSKNQKESSPGLSCAVKVGEKRQRNECGESYNAGNRSVLHKNKRVTINSGGARKDSESGKQVHVVDLSTTEDPISNAINLNQKMDRNQDAQVGTVVENSEDVVDNNRRGFNDNGDAGRQEESGWGKLLHQVNCSEVALPDIIGNSGNLEVDKHSEDVLDKAVDNNRRGFNDDGDAAGRLEASEWGKQLCEADRPEVTTLPNVISNNQKLNEKNKTPGLCDSGSGDVVPVQPKMSECAGLKFNDFNKRREDAKFSECQAITYLEPDPVDEKEIQWFEEDLPVSVGNFRFGKNQNTKDRSLFSHPIRCQGSIMTGNFTVSPRKGETWAIFKNWDIINWSSEPDSHRSYEYDIVEILSNTTDEGVSVAVLHKAKGFASVFFRMGEADVIQIPSQSLYRFSHNILSFKMKRVDIKGVPKDAYELDQAALPETIEERVVPCHLYAETKPEALCFPNKGKVFQTGQIWSFYSGGNDDTLPLHYCRIQKITLIQAFEEEAVFKLHVGRLKAKPFNGEVIQWEDKRMPVGCGTFLVRRINDVITADDVSHQIVPQTSLDGSEYTILPKIGEVWAVYRSWTCQKEFKEVGCCEYDIVEVLDDNLGYKVLALEHVLSSNEGEEKRILFRAAESRHTDCDGEDGTEVIFTIPKSKILRFSHQIPASRVTEEMQGELKEFFEVDCRALPTNVRRAQDH